MSLIYGTLDHLNVREAIDALSRPGSFAVIATLDSGREVSSMSDLADRIDDFDDWKLGTAVCLPTQVLLQLDDSDDGFFFGYDEVWLFAERPYEHPLDFAITVDRDFTQERVRRIEVWMASSGAYAGVGDGDGVNFCTLEPPVAAALKRAAEDASG